MTEADIQEAVVRCLFPLDFLFEAAAMAKAIGGGVIVCETKDGIIYARKEIWPKKWSGPTEKILRRWNLWGDIYVKNKNRVG